MENHSNLLGLRLGLNSRPSKMPLKKQSIHRDCPFSESSTSGHKIYAFWALVVVLCILAWGNMILTIVIFRVLHLGQGMESMEFIPDHGIIKFYGEAIFEKLFKPDGQIKGFDNSPFEITGRKGAVIFEVEDNKGKIKNTFKIEQNGTHVKGVKSFNVGESFSTNSPNIAGASKNLEAKLVSTGHITSSLNEKLVLRSDMYTRLSGSEGTNIEGKEIFWTADQQVYLKSINGSIMLSGKEGVSIDVTKIPIVRSRSTFLTTQYKVCVCMPQGKLFRVPVSKDFSSHAACYNIDVSPQYDPCM